MWRPKTDSRYHLLPCVLRQDLCLNPEFTIQLDWLACRSRNPPVLAASTLGLQPFMVAVVSYVGFWYPNPGPLSCVAALYCLSNLSTPQFAFLKNYLLVTNPVKTDFVSIS